MCTAELGQRLAFDNRQSRTGPSPTDRLTAVILSGVDSDGLTAGVPQVAMLWKAETGSDLALSPSRKM